MIYVDQAVWPWRGNHWAHLISDSDPEELHDFAETIGKRRAGFQGDHYDVTIYERERALQANAQPVDAREIVRKLNRGGLRRRGGLPKWNVLFEQACKPDEIAGLLGEKLFLSKTNAAEDVTEDDRVLAEKLSTASNQLFSSASVPGIDGFVRGCSQEFAVTLLQRAVSGRAEAALLMSHPACSEDDLNQHKPAGRTASQLGLALGISEVRKPVILRSDERAILGLDLLVFSNQT